MAGAPGCWWDHGALTDILVGEIDCAHGDAAQCHVRDLNSKHLFALKFAYRATTFDRAFAYIAGFLTGIPGTF